MANTRSAAKRARQTIRRTARNRKTKIAVKSSVKAARAVIASAKPEATEQLSKTFSQLDKAAKSGVVHPNKPNRLKSRLTKAAAKAKAGAAA